MRQYNREKRVCTVSVNQWATNGEKQDEEKCGQFWKLSEQGEQPSVVCSGDTEDSQRGESCNNQDVKEQRQRQGDTFNGFFVVFVVVATNWRSSFDFPSVFLKSKKLRFKTKCCKQFVRS